MQVESGLITSSLENAASPLRPEVEMIVPYSAPCVSACVCVCVCFFVSVSVSQHTSLHKCIGVYVCESPHLQGSVTMKVWLVPLCVRARELARSAMILQGMSYYASPRICTVPEIICPTSCCCPLLFVVFYCVLFTGGLVYFHSQPCKIP